MKSRKKEIFLKTFMIAVLVATAGCAQKPEAARPPEAGVTPVEIVEGDHCDECGMAIKDMRFAAQIIYKDGTVKKFDDIGCMLIHYDEMDKEALKAIFVKDYNVLEWVNAKEAMYIIGSDVKTPMMYGIIAFKDMNSGMKFKGEHGGEMVHKFEDLKTPMPMKMGEMEGMEDMEHGEHMEGM